MTAAVSPSPVFVGIDVSKEALDAQVLAPGAPEDACAFSAPNTAAGVDALRQKLKPYCVRLGSWSSSPPAATSAASRSSC